MSRRLQQCLGLLRRCRDLLRIELHALTAAHDVHAPDPRLQLYYHLLADCETALGIVDLPPPRRAERSQWSQAEAIRRMLGEGVPARTIAERLGVSLSAVYMTRYRARRSST